MSFSFSVHPNSSGFVSWAKFNGTMAFLKSLAICILITVSVSKARYIEPDDEDPNRFVFDPAIEGITADPLPPPNAVNFLGVGYNLLYGNPEGGSLSNGGIDPGLLVTRRILKLTYDEDNTSPDLKYQIPDEVEFVPRSSCVSESSVEMFHGTSSYQEKTTREISTSVGAGGLFYGVEFSFSNRYEDVKSDTETQSHIFREERTRCNKGQARYLTELANVKKYYLEDGFVAAACQLSANYDQNLYMNFLDTWGTHFVSQVDVGTKETDRYFAYKNEFVQYSHKNNGNTVSPKLYVGGYKMGVSVDMTRFKQDFNSNTKFGSKSITYKSGDAEMHEPVSLVVMGMHEVLTLDYWRNFGIYVVAGLCDDVWDMAAAYTNMYTALTGYDDWKNAQISTDPLVEIPITWPTGYYGLPRLAYNYDCPDSKTVNWNTGWRLQDTENWGTNSWSSSYHMKGPVYENDMYQHFCMKPYYNDEYNWVWPSGRYCIFAGRSSSSCPTGLRYGYVQWDDEGSHNHNSKSGSLPYGTYDSDITKIYFCCSTSGSSSTPIYLPTDDKFAMFRYGSSCQKVCGMSVTEEYFYWDTQNSFCDDKTYGSYPSYGIYDYWGENIRLQYCYYVPNGRTC